MLAESRFSISDRQWRLGLLVLLAINLLGLRFLLSGEDVYTGNENHDTRVIAQRIDGGYGPADWWTGDWPLGNHFYRPLPSHAYQVDLALWGHDYSDYKISTWLFAASCAFALLFFVRQLTDSRAWALGAAALFSLWQTDALAWLPWQTIGQICGLGLLLFGVFSRSRIPILASTAVLTYFVCLELGVVFAQHDLSQASFGYRASGWPPGRTATLMTLFGLLCLGFYCGYEREKKPWMLVGSATCFAAAFCSYEQAVALVPCLVGCAVFLRLQGIRPNFWLFAVPVVLTLAYIWWHRTYLPMDSSYQEARERGLPSSLIHLGYYLFPTTPELPPIYYAIDKELLPWSLLDHRLWVALMLVTANILLFKETASKWKPYWFGIALSVIAFAPLAFTKHLTHYLYFPQALRAIAVVTLLLLLAERIRELRATFRRPQSEQAAVETREDLLPQPNASLL